MMMLNEKDLAILTNKLQAPMVTLDVMEGREELTDDLRYSLHELLSNFEPDTALLAIALSARKIASTYSVPANIQVLQMECDRIISDYGFLWLQNVEHGQVDEAALMDTLIHIVEDLEGLKELLDSASTLLKIQNPEAAQLCEVFRIQAKAQAMVADTFIKTADMALEREEPTCDLVPVESISNDNERVTAV